MVQISAEKRSNKKQNSSTACIKKKDCVQLIAERFLQMFNIWPPAVWLQICL